jgi:hypothetical protein
MKCRYDAERDEYVVDGERCRVLTRVPGHLSRPRRLQVGSYATGILFGAQIGGMAT